MAARLERLRGNPRGRATLSHIKVGVRELRNQTSQVIDAVRAGERVVLTVHGEAVADIVPLGSSGRSSSPTR
jgi:prevent-host-death family protein